MRSQERLLDFTLSNADMFTCERETPLGEKRLKNYITLILNHGHFPHLVA